MSEIKVLSSIATKEAYLELVPQFEKASGHTVATTWSGTTAIMKQLAAGEQYDLVMISGDRAGRTDPAGQDRRRQPGRSRQVRHRHRGAQGRARGRMSAPPMR